MTYYIYAYDIYGARSYFTVRTVPKYCKMDKRLLENYFSEIASKKLGVNISKVRLGMYDTEKFDQGHMPSNWYHKGKWISHTTDD